MPFFVRFPAEVKRQRFKKTKNNNKKKSRVTAREGWDPTGPLSPTHLYKISKLGWALGSEVPHGVKVLGGTETIVDLVQDGTTRM